jgi:EmrB/QacA subfamily drug resistance transporter
VGDRFGRKPTLMVGLGMFAVFSLGAALSKSTTMLIGMRAMMGIGAAIIMPITLSLVTATFQKPKERAQAIAFWAAVMPLGMGIGPLLGGWLLDKYHWSSVFYINIPIITVGLIGCFYFIQNSKAENPHKIDFAGTVLSIAGLLALVFAIVQAGAEGWTGSRVLLTFGLAFILLGLFVFLELRSSNPMLPLKFFKNMSFTGANIALTLVYFGLMGAFFFLGQFLLSVQGYTPFQAGVRILPLAVVAFISTVLSAPIANRIGIKYTVALGILITAVGFLYFAGIAAVDVSYADIVIAMSITALGIGFTTSPATNSIMGSVPVGQSGVGSAVNNTTRQIGIALGVAILGSILNSTYLTWINGVKWPAQLSEQAIDVIRGSVQGAHIIAQNVSNPYLSEMIISRADQAFTAGSANALFVGAILMVITFIITLLILPSQVKNEMAKDGFEAVKFHKRISLTSPIKNKQTSE